MAKPPAVYHEHQLLQFQNCTTDKQVAAGTTGSVEVIPAKTGHTIYVRKIKGAHFAGSASIATFQDSSSSPVKVGVANMANTGSVEVIDASPIGVAIQEGFALNVSFSAGSGPGVYYVEAYYFPSAVLAPTSPSPNV